MSEHVRKTGAERLIGLSKTIDKVSIVGGAVVGLAFNPVLGGLIIGGSLASMEAGNRLEIGLRNRRAKKLGNKAVAASL